MKVNTRRSALISMMVSLATLLGACSSIEVERYSDPDANFQTMKDWSWLPDQGRKTETEGGLDASTVKGAIEATLVEKGFPMAEQNPDFHVTYHEGLDYDVELTTFRDRYGYGYRAWWSAVGHIGPMADRTTFVTRTLERVLTIDVITTGDNKELIWRGVGRFNYDPDAAAGERTEQVRKAVAEILETFPPEGSE